MIKKKKQSRSQSSTEKIPKKTHESSQDSSSPSPRLLSIFRSKLASGMFRGMRSKTAPGLSSQSRIVRCPKCHKLLQEPIDATIYKCSGCDSILQAKPLELESNDNSIPEALLSNQNSTLSTEVESAQGGNKTPMRSTYSRASPSVERGYHSETVYKHETSDIRREWMRRADEFSGDSDAFASARSSPYNSRSNAYEELPRVPFYPASPSPSSAYEYGYTSPFHGSQVSASEQSYYNHQPNQFKQYGREGWFQESSGASPIRFRGETSDGKYNHWSSQSHLHDPQYHNLHESSSSATQHRSVYSERSYHQSATAPYSEHSKSETSSEKSSLREKKKYVRKRNPVVKRYVLPSAGGAPFVTCSYCLELLQLPQVSLHGKHKRYQVRCGSCSGVLKFSVREKVDTVLHSPSFVDETVTNHQDSTSEGHEEIYPDDSHLSSSDNGSGDRICKNTNEEEIRSISSKFLDSKLEALQPQWKPSLNHKLREQQPASSEAIGETLRIHLEQPVEAHSEKPTEMDDNNVERVGCDLDEARYEKNGIQKLEEMFGDGSGESLMVPVYKNEIMSDLSIEAETVADALVSHSVEPLNKNVYVCETRILSDNTRHTQEFGLEETRENQENEGERKWEGIMGDKPGFLLEKSDSICDTNSSNGEMFEDTELKKDTKHISNTFPVNENQSFIGNLDQSGKATVTTARIHEEQSKYEYENLSERQELDKTTSDRVKSELEEFNNETNEALEPCKVSIEGETGDERLVSHQMDSPNKNVETSYEILEYAGERTWTETMEDRAVLHLEEYERYYENDSKPFEWNSAGALTFHKHEYELGAILEPEEEAQRRSASSSRGSFNDHESSEESAVLEGSQDAKPDQFQYEHEISSERPELSNTVFDMVRSELQESKYETSETFEPGKMVRVGSVVSLEKASERTIGETDEERFVKPLYLEGSGCSSERTWTEIMGDGARLQMKEYQNNSQEWTTERAPTFRLHEYELGAMPAPEDDANGRSISSSMDFFSDHESSKQRVVPHEEEPWMVDENKINELKDGLMVEDGQSLHLEKCIYDSTKLEDTIEWTARTPIFCLHESELETMLQPDEDADGRSESSSTGSFNNQESSKWRDVVHEEESQLMSDGRTEKLQVREVTKDRVPLDLEKGGNESMKLEDTIEWTSERAPTFRLHESELGTMLQPEEDADGRSESSSRSSFNDHGISKEREVSHEEEPTLVIDSRNESQQDTVPLHLEECGNESMKLNETFQWTSRRTLTFRRRESMLEPDEDVDGRSASSLRGSFNDRGTSKEGEDEPWMVDDTLEQERMTFHMDMSKDKQLNLRQTFKQGDTEEHISASGSMVSSEGHESPSKIAEGDSEAKEEILGDHLDHFHKENEKSGLTSEPYVHFYNTTEPSEIVGLRHALYQTQTSPLRSPLSSPIHTPIGSPLHILMRSPIASPIHSHIVSPLRSPINTSGSLSDVLFFGKKA